MACRELTRVAVQIKENLREMIGLHTCDKRSTRTILEEAYREFFSLLYIYSRSG